MRRIRVVVVCWLILGIVTACAGTGGVSPVPQEEAEEMATAVAETPAHDGADATATDSPEPTATAEPALTLGEEQVVEQGGFAFQPIDGWEVEIQRAIAAMRPAEADPQQGPTIVLGVSTLEALNIEGVSTSDMETADELFAGVLASLDLETAAMTLEDVEEVTVDGQPARAVRFSSSGFANIEDDATGYIVAALFDDTSVFVMLGLASPPEAWQHDAAFAAVRDSVRLQAAEE